MNPVQRHNHDGTTSQRLSAEEAIERAPQSALTTKSAGTLSSGGLTGLTSADSLILTNMQTRINELETKLQAIGLIK